MDTPPRVRNEGDDRHIEESRSLMGGLGGLDDESRENVLVDCTIAVAVRHCRNPACW